MIPGYEEGAIELKRVMKVLRYNSTYVAYDILGCSKSMVDKMRVGQRKVTLEVLETIRKFIPPQL